MEFLFCHSAPLGSIPELPTESCSEIMASEGNEMVNGDYWIYSDGNGQTILARCEGMALTLYCLHIANWKLNLIMLNNEPSKSLFSKW